MHTNGPRHKLTVSSLSSSLSSLMIQFCYAMSEEILKLASNKRIILCSDGTWRASDMGDKSAPSNVAKLARAIASSGRVDEKNGEKKVVKQIVSYYSGLGSGDLPFQKALYGVLGWGLDIDVCQIYDFISNNYEDGDELFFFGFSRGAFTVRSVAGLVCDVGVLSAVHMLHFADMWKAYRKNTSGKPFRETAWYNNNKEKLGLRDVRIKVIGVWDTVGALVCDAGQDGNCSSLTDLIWLGNPGVAREIDYAFQALAIDERRLTFPPTLWDKNDDDSRPVLQQCWFPGVHGNIGGGQRKDLEEIGHNTFAWMVDNLSGMLTFEDTAIEALIEEHRRVLNTHSWGCGPIIDNFSGLTGAFFRLLGKKDRTPGACARDQGDGTSVNTKESFHPITRIRKDNLNYEPASLQVYAHERCDDSKGWRWNKEGLLSIPEYYMCPDKKMTVAYKEGGSVKYDVKESLSRLLCPGDTLLELDRDNEGNRRVG
ncbi:Uncharacterized protein HZ326_24263 [Fusarium oxysporum f. sp. albedinis]|nr:Uncharacterized protein HZ326_24263 [Fusarium oxysporum f. sp. albedinis]